MGSICSNLCCCCCCCGGEKTTDTRRMLRTKQKKNLKLLKDITPSKVKAAENPLEVKTSEMTEMINIPHNKHGLQTEADVFRFKGYELKEQFDMGGFASVHTAIHIEKQLRVACKKIPIPAELDAKSKKKRTSLLTDIKNELYVLQKTDHPNVIKMIQHFIIEQKSQTTFYIMMQMAQGGNLSNKLDEYGPFNERKCKRWFAQILSGLNYMYDKGIAHRDLKLANILLDEAQDVLISDFGLSRFVWRKSEGPVLLSKTYCGTPPYMAPEVLDIPIKRQEMSEYEYNAFQADVWSCGVILFKLFNKRYPFAFVKGPVKAVKTMRAKKWAFAKGISHPPSEELKDIMNKLLEPDPEVRIDLKALVTHLWIRDQFNSVEEKNSKRMKKP